MPGPRIADDWGEEELSRVFSFETQHRWITRRVPEPRQGKMGNLGSHDSGTVGLCLLTLRHDDIIITGDREETYLTDHLCPSNPHAQRQGMK